MSELVGLVLLVGIVMAGVALLATSNFDLTESTLQEARVESTEQSFQQFAAEMDTLVERDREGVANFEIDGRHSSRGRMSTLSGGEIVIAPSASTGCGTPFRLDLDAIRYQVPDGPTYVYQAGAVWKITDGGATMVNPPDVTYENGTLTVETVTIDGQTSGDGDFTVRERPQISAADTRNTEKSVERCRRPDLVTITVRSRYPELWRQYFEREFPASAYVGGSGPTAQVRLDEDELPRRVDDSVNTVVDFTDSTMPGTIQGGTPGAGGHRGGTPVIDKGTEVEYSASVTLLSAQVGSSWQDPDEVDNMVTRPGGRPPTDVAMVVDSSASMGDEIAIGGWSIEQRRLADGLAGFGARNTTYYDGEYSVLRFGDTVEPTISPTTNVEHARNLQDIPRNTNPKTGPVVGEAIAQAHGTLASRENAPRDAIVMITDGRGCNAACQQNAFEEARRAVRDSDIPVHVVGVGPDPDREFLRNLAAKGGGTYSEVTDEHTMTAYAGFFERKILGNVTTSRTIRREIRHNPTLLTITAGSTSVAPWTGTTPANARADPAAHSINFPKPAGQTRGFYVPDGEPIQFEFLVYPCGNYAKTGYLEGPPYNRLLLHSLMRCTATSGGPSTPGSPIYYRDGDPLPSGGSPSWWQDPLVAKLPPSTVTDTNEDGVPDQFDLQGDQIVVVYEMNDFHGGTDYNNLVFLLEVGDARTQAPGDWTIDVEVSSVTVENE